MLQHAPKRFPRSRAGFHCDLHCANCLDGFAARDPEHARFIRARNAARRFGDVATCALCRAQSLIARIPIRNPRVPRRTMQSLSFETSFTQEGGRENLTCKGGGSAHAPRA